MKKLYVIFGIIFLVVVFLIILGKRPKYGQIIKGNTQITVAPKEKIKYENEYFSFFYDDDYLSRNEGNTFWLTGKTGINESLTVISKKFGEAVEEDSAVKMRQVKTEEYDEEKINIAGADGLFFIKKDKSERTVFVFKNGVLISFSMTANSNDEKIGDKFREMIESWEWR